jgi:hypothetical protein
MNMTLKASPRFDFTLSASPSSQSHPLYLSQELVRAKMELAELKNELSVCQGNHYQLQKQFKLLEEKSIYNILNIF